MAASVGHKRAKKSRYPVGNTAGLTRFHAGCERFSASGMVDVERQCSKLGATVRAGERSNMVVYFNVGEERLNAKTGKLSKPFLLRYIACLTSRNASTVSKP